MKRQWRINIVFIKFHCIQTHHIRCWCAKKCRISKKEEQLISAIYLRTSFRFFVVSNLCSQVFEVNLRRMKLEWITFTISLTQNFLQKNQKTNFLAFTWPSFLKKTREFVHQRFFFRSLHYDFDFFCMFFKFSRTKIRSHFFKTH
jgi:hypothetical protein